MQRKNGSPNSASKPRGDGNTTKRSSDADAAEESDDIIFSRQSIAAWLDLTPGRINQLVLEGFPKVGRGMHPFRASILWYIRYLRNLLAARSENPERKRMELARAATLEARLKEQTGHLIDKAEVVMVMSAQYARFGKQLDHLPIALGREFGWPAEVIRTVRERIDAMRLDFVRGSAEFVEVEQPETKRARIRRSRTFK